ncbi:helix-turn-helix transcriptional regulator [Solwaraspora sp. WMMD406]|uniref:helix-turn-helix domain-containing protein n=1 Tax=Solwaraspora sp. WMMD406 TaxID=3016095 RepID=UPI002417224B|nr:helix-turn-helix transcriptional regulator [Solwaraspora sp. WMMD406]MDG4763916.1 helix-turn-helix transcriptional regulator [Solwaraspora sp. WMMD406]
MDDLPKKLRQLRLSRHMNQTQLAKAVGVSKSLIASFETGRLVPKEDTAKALDKLLNSGDRLQQLSKDGREDRRPWLRSWAEHERRAMLLRCWDLSIIPGLLQREAYMRELFGTIPANKNRVDDLVRIRLARQAAVFDRDEPVELSCLIGETALHQGTREVLKDQLAYLVDASHQPNIRIRIVPDRGVSLHPGLGGPLSLATLSDGRRIAYLDDQLRGRMATTADDIIELEWAWEVINELSLSTVQSRDLILRLIDEHK